MRETTDKEAERLRCTSCGRVDTPRLVGAGPGSIAIALWVGAALLWGLGYILDAAWPAYAAALVFLGALVYTMWYFARRERACRHCGARHLEPSGGADPG